MSRATESIPTIEQLHTNTSERLSRMKYATFNAEMCARVR
jgi:hypothetical protein